jgi:hypothetical protein
MTHHMTELENLIVTKNIVHFDRLLRDETDPDKRSLLLRLLKTEIRKRLGSSKRRLSMT